MPLGGDRPNDTRFQPAKKKPKPPPKRSTALEALNPFINSIAKKGTSVPPVPPSITKYAKKPPAQKLKEYGFVGAAVNDRIVGDFLTARQRAIAMERTQAINRLNTQGLKGYDPNTQRLEPADPGMIKRQNARDTIARIEAIPWKDRPKGWVGELTAAKKAADLPVPRSDAIVDAIVHTLTDKQTKDYLRNSPGARTQVAGITTFGPVGDILNAAGKELAGIPAGIAGIVSSHGAAGASDTADIASSQANLFGKLLSSPQYGSLQKQQWRDFADQAKQSWLDQYGPGTSWSESLKMSSEHPVSSILSGVGLAAAAVYPGTIALGLSKGLSLTDAIAAARVPVEPRTLRLQGGKRAMGVPVEATYSRSPLTRTLLNRPYDFLSGKISPEAPVIGRVAESTRAARITRRNLKRDARRAQAEAIAHLNRIGHKAEAEELRAVYTRGKPKGATEEEWLKAQLDDVSAMLDGREMILPSRSDPKLVKLRNRVHRLQRKFDAKQGDVDVQTVERKLEPLRNEERTLRAKIRSAKERNQPTEAIAPLEARLKNVQDQLAVARGHDVGPVSDSPSRNDMRAIMEQALPPEQVETGMQIADQFARGASPDNPEAWYARIVSRWAENPESVGLDANALLQEAGPRTGLSGNPVRLDESSAHDAYMADTEVTTKDGRKGVIASQGGAGEAMRVRLDDGTDVMVRPEDLTVEATHGEPIVFYSKAQRVAAQLPEKSSPQQIVALLKKNGVKDVELYWTGFDDWIESHVDRGTKSLSKQQVIDYFDNPLNAFDLNETLWEQNAYPHPTKWGEGDYSGVSLYDIDGTYKELMIQLPGDQVYRSDGHMPGIDNPVVQIRFHELRGGGILIDEMQSDWGANLRDYNYKGRPKDADAQLAKLRQRHTDLSIGLTQRVNDALGITFDQGGFGSAESTYHVATKLKELRRKMDKDWREGQGIEIGIENVEPGTLDPSDPRVAAFNAWLETPERAGLARLIRHADNVRDKSERMSARESQLLNAPADQPYKKTWELLGLKRMVAWAVHEGYDSVAWPQGIVPALRYGKVDPADHLTPVGGHHGGDPEEHPDYPQAKDYQRGYTYHETEFETPDAGPPQTVLFGADQYGQRNVPWQGVESYGQLHTPDDVPMGLTGPAHYDAAMLAEAGFDMSHELGDLVPGMLIHIESGPLANQFIRVTHVDEHGIDAMPSGIKSIEVRGSSDGDGDWQEFEVSIKHADGTDYLSGSTVQDAFNDRYSRGTLPYSDLTDSAWFDDMERAIDQGWQHELDDDMYHEAVDDFVTRYENGDIEPVNYDTEGAIYDPYELARLDPGTSGNPYRYDTILTSAANKEWKRYGVKVEKGSVEGTFTNEGEGAISERGPIPTWEMRIPPEMADDVRQGQTFFQTATPISRAQGVEVKGAVELLGNKRFRLTLFQGADISTVIHELGHISLWDLDADSLNTIERDLAGGRSLKAGEWTVQDNERYARAWEQFFRGGYASTTSLRRVFNNIMQWMRRVYTGVKELGDPISPEVQRVLEKRLGKVGIDEADRAIPNPELNRWGVLLSHAKGELEAYELRQQVAREKGTDEAMRAEIRAYEKQQDVAYKHGDTEQWNALQGKIDATAKVLRDRDALQGVRSKRRHSLLMTRAAELEKALQKPDSRRYQGARAAADFFQDTRELILQEVFGDIYDEVFAGRRAQESEWLAARGMLDPDLVGEGRGFLPMRRPTSGAAARVKESARSLTGKIGKPKTDTLNLHTRNQMILWQQGDYRADIHVLHEQYVRALSFKVQYDLRSLLHEIGEPVGADGPKPGWYLVDLDGKPLPREWKSANTPEEIEAKLSPLLDGLAADDSQLALSLVTYAENWIHQDFARIVPDADGGYGHVRQVHPRIVETMMLPYTGPAAANPLSKIAGFANSLARMSLIYANPGYIPSNIIANFILLVAERGVFALPDMVFGAHLVAKDSALFNRILGGYTPEGRRARVGAEMGETHTTSTQRGGSGPQNLIGHAEGYTASKMSVVADEWMRAAAWSGIARKRGYRGRDAQMRLLEGRTEKARRDRDWVSEKATNAMINFDRLSPWEQRWLRPILFVWPFIRGATAWPISYTLEHPFRAGAAVQIAEGPGEANREELGPTPSYYPGLSLISKTGKVGKVANLGSVNPIGVLGQMAQTGGAALASFTGEKPTGPFLNLAGFLAPQYDLFTQLIQGRDQYGNEVTTKDLLTGRAGDFLPILPMTLDILDETKPAIQMDQGVIDTLIRRTFRWTPQKVNLAVLNQQAKGRGAAKTVSQKKDAEIKVARAAWKHVAPGLPMPRQIEQSIEAYYSVQEMRATLKEELKKQKDYQPNRREPLLTPLQETAIVYDLMKARFPASMEGVPDPEAILTKYGEEALNKFKNNLESSLFEGKRTADKARAADKRLKKAAA